jgi:adenosylmethionine-8-amino-7-oxononanoate aminotransferase
MILAIEMVADRRTRQPFPGADRRGLRAYRYALEHGVVLRPLGDILYWMPPYCVGEDELLRLAEVTLGAVNEATR